jgi:hypothetical protein
MLCSQVVRDGPLRRYAERGLARREMRSQLLPFLSRSLKVHGASNEMPMMSPNIFLSRCQPIPAPGAYSVTSACLKSSGRWLANEANGAPDIVQFWGDCGCFDECLLAVVVPPAVRHDPAVPFEAAGELEWLQW